MAIILICKLANGDILYCRLRLRYPRAVPAAPSAPAAPVISKGMTKDYDDDEFDDDGNFKHVIYIHMSQLSEESSEYKYIP